MQIPSEAFLKNPATALAIALLKKLRHQLQVPHWAPFHGAIIRLFRPGGVRQ